MMIGAAWLPATWLPATWLPTAWLLATMIGAAAPPWIPVFVRIDQPPTPAELAILEEHGVRGFLVGASDQESLEALRGRPVLVEEVLPDGNLRLKSEDMQRYFESYFTVRDPALTTRPACFQGDLVSRGLREAAKNAAGALAPYSPAGLFLVDDPSITVGSEPFDWCYCEACQSRFGIRFDAYVALYPDLLRHTGIDEAGPFEPWAVDRARARNLDKPRREVNLFPWLIWRRFMDESLATELAALGDLARHASGAPTGFLGGAPSNPFGGHDWRMLASSSDILLPPDDPSSRAICASFQEEGGLLMTSVRSTGGTERVARQKILDHFLTESHGILFESMSQIITADPSGNPAPTVLLNVTHEVVTQLERNLLAVADAVPNSEARVGIFYSPESLDVLWMKDSEADGVWWPSRSGRLGRELLPLAGVWWGWQLLLEDIGAPYRYVDGRTLIAPDRLSELSALILPRAIVLSEAEAAGVRQFVEAGGLLLADSETGLFDEMGRGRDRGVLDDVFQLERDDHDRPWDFHWEEIREPDDVVERRFALRVVEPFTSSGEKGELIDREYGEGRAIYLNLNVADYVGVREVRSEAPAAMVKLMRDWLRSAGISAPVGIERVDGELMTRVKMWPFTGRDGGEFLALRRNETLPEMRGNPEDPTPLEYRVTFDRPRNVMNVTTGTASRGEVRELIVEIAPAEWVLLKLR